MVAVKVYMTPTPTFVEASDAINAFEVAVRARSFALYSTGDSAT